MAESAVEEIKVFTICKKCTFKNFIYCFAVQNATAVSSRVSSHKSELEMAILLWRESKRSRHWWSLIHFLLLSAFMMNSDKLFRGLHFTSSIKYHI